jgi:hypothetical protein
LLIGFAQASPDPVKSQSQTLPATLSFQTEANPKDLADYFSSLDKMEVEHSLSGRRCGFGRPFGANTFED